MLKLRKVGFLVLLLVGLVGGCGGGSAVATGEEPQVDDKADRIDCSYVKCALPLCAEGQQLRTQGGCCPVCVGAPSRCAAVLCAAVACAEGEILVTSEGQCCGRCVKAPPVKECADDLDCPQYACFACPCPVSTCQGARCVTYTPPASSCGTL